MNKSDSIFKPLHLQDMDYVRIVTNIYYATDKLVHFGYTNFLSVVFMQQLKNKCLLLLKRQKEIMDWIGSSLPSNTKKSYKIE